MRAREAGQVAGASAGDRQVRTYRGQAQGGRLADQLDRLSGAKPDDREAIRSLSAEIRRTIEGTAIPDDLAAAIARPLAWIGEDAGPPPRVAGAVRPPR